MSFTWDGAVHQRSVEPLVQLETLHAEAGLAGVQPGVRASMGASIIAAQLSLWRRCAGGGTQMARVVGAAAALGRRAGH